MSKLTHRWRVWRLYWWLPSLLRHKLASGPFEGWHLLWGPLHAWRTTGHNGIHERRLTWR